MSQSDWIFCEKTVVHLLLHQQSLSFPLEPQSLKTEQTIYFDSIQRYCHTVGLPVSSFCSQSFFRDGCTLRSADGSFFVILYNEWDDSPQRRRFTLAHEMGHIVLSHTDDDRSSETLANQFASHLLIPRIALQYLKKKGVPFSVQEFANFFGVSLSAMRLAYEETFYDGILEEDRLLLKFQKELDAFSDRLIEPPLSL